MLILMLLLPEEQEGETWEPFNIAVLFNMGNIGRRITSTLSACL